MSATAAVQRINALFLAFTIFIGYIPLINAQSMAINVDYMRNQRLWFDVNGNQVDVGPARASGGYLIGPSFAEKGREFGVKLYTSPDEMTWIDEGYLFDPYQNNPCVPIGECKSFSYHANLLWVNAGANGLWLARRQNLNETFIFDSSPVQLAEGLEGLEIGDISVNNWFQDKPYMTLVGIDKSDTSGGSIWPGPSRSIYVIRLNKELTNMIGPAFKVTTQDSTSPDLIDQQVGSPKMFVFGPASTTWYIVASGTCESCAKSATIVYSSMKPEGGQWKRQILSDASCGITFSSIFNGYVSGSMMGMRYAFYSSSPGGSQARFTGYQFDYLKEKANNTIGLREACPTGGIYTSYSSFPKGKEGIIAKAVDKAPLLAEYQPVCDSDRYILFQTWKSAKTGVLKQVAINIAASSQTVPLTLELFRFESIEKLRSASYKYETLHTATIERSQLSYIFKTASIFPNVEVSQGDQLGVKIAGNDFAPYCHLEYNGPSLNCTIGWNQNQNCVPANMKFEHTLLELGIGQLSPQGFNGEVSPVGVRNSTVKFFTVVE